MRSTWQEWLMALFFPHKCFMCGRIVAGVDWLCPACRLPMTEDLCPRCGKPWDTCVCGTVSYDGAYAPLWYKDGVRQGIHRFKYDGRTYYGRFLGELMAAGLVDTLGEIPFDLVSYVPMHRQKERARGYSQSRILAREVAARLALPLEETLCHTGNRKTQVEQHGILARKENAKKSFVGAGKDLQGLSILLVDDVLTTGATLSCCAELLKEQGARSVYVLTAVTVEKGYAP